MDEISFARVLEMLNNEGNYVRCEMGYGQENTHSVQM
jgi:hypothetical protein